MGDRTQTCGPQDTTRRHPVHDIYNPGMTTKPSHFPKVLARGHYFPRVQAFSAIISGGFPVTGSAQTPMGVRNRFRRKAGIGGKSQ